MERGEVFRRVEKKYLLSDEQYRMMLFRLAQNGMRPDEYGLSTISNLYYDTPDFLLIRRSLEKPVYKEKLRLRAYGTPNDDSPAYVEIKKKYKGVVYKRRVRLPLALAAECLDVGKLPDTLGQIGRELDYFLRLYQPVKKVLLAYDREAFFLPGSTTLRVTFDHAIRCREQKLDLAQGSAGRLLLEDGRHLMELKLVSGMPLWLAHTLGELSIRQTSYSKYGTYYTDLQQQTTKEGQASA